LILTLAVGVLGAISVVLTVEWMTVQLVSPVRQPLTDYHRQWIDQPEAHGITIRSMSLGKTATPVLCVEPAGEQPARRGAILRRQLREHGFAPADFGVIRAELILLHGRNGRKEGLLPIAERFCAAGFRCLIPDLPAGSFAGAEQDAELPMRLLEDWRAQSGETLPCGMWGISLGGAFATHAAALAPEAWFGMVLINTFDQLDGVVREQASARFHWTGPWMHRAVGWNAHRKSGLDLKKIAPAHWASRVTTPVLTVHGTEDAVVPLQRGRRLFDAFASHDKEWLEVEGGGHDDVLVTPMQLYAAMSGWLLQRLPPPTLTSR